VLILSIKDQIELTLFARTVDFRLNLLSKMHKVAINCEDWLLMSVMKRRASLLKNK